MFYVLLDQSIVGTKRKLISIWPQASVCKKNKLLEEKTAKGKL
jgi:hypothetical protein